MFKGVSRDVLGCFMEDEECLEDTSRVLQESFNGIPKKCKGCIKVVSKVFQGSLMGSSRDFQVFLQGASRVSVGCQDFFREV